MSTRIDRREALGARILVEEEAGEADEDTVAIIVVGEEADTVVEEGAEEDGGEGEAHTR